MAETPPRSGDGAPRYTDQDVDGIVARRAAIEQVKGMLMFAFGVDADEAFAMLRDEARSRRIKLSVLARAILNDHALVRRPWG